MSVEVPYLQLHFDVNGTMILQDKAIRKNDVKQILKEEFAKRAVGRNDNGTFVWNGNIDWETWEENYDPEAGDLTYAEFVKKHLKDEDKQRCYENFIDSPEMAAFRPVIDDLYEKSRVPDDGTENEDQHYYILPSFFQLLNHLIENERKFNIILRSYGSEVRLGKLREELNSFFSGYHPRFKVAFSETNSTTDSSDSGSGRGSGSSSTAGYNAYDDRKASSNVFRRLSSKRRISAIIMAARDPSELDVLANAQLHRRLENHRHIGILHRDEEGAVLSLGTANRPPTATDWCDTHTFDIPPGQYEDTRDGRAFYAKQKEENPDIINVFEGFEAIYRRFGEATEVGETIAIRDDYPWWKTNHFASTAGKPHLINPMDDHVHPIFFDDNIKAAHGQSHIIDVLDIHNKTNIPFKEANDKYVVAAHPLRALVDVNYYVNALQTCEENRRRTLV
mmetsp:Transcript_3887/g.4481  ORF Transcript_3887/g.4481 Transcript_3887/m.4481 type:complete len:449 (-) Transcript_3887:172-1518(-)|eukprot:CAMPEP_0184016220 /NCGR_PEP_ID=MMETSP0954-20121128/6798_1 /TAXON_ID=627963 /ORGANISM="Aplanochytrium sp, Strain PBS07" /LENGTH=448 /DNA_ID=CAMNT_0026297197 /DNA_START=690 /DNA_END=2036 /DNA_ORIENTATION=-